MFGSTVLVTVILPYFLGGHQSHPVVPAPEADLMVAAAGSAPLLVGTQPRRGATTGRPGAAVSVNGTVEGTHELCSEHKDSQPCGNYAFSPSQLAAIPQRGTRPSLGRVCWWRRGVENPQQSRPIQHYCSTTPSTTLATAISPFSVSSATATATFRAVTAFFVSDDGHIVAGWCHGRYP